MRSALAPVFGLLLACAPAPAPPASAQPDADPMLAELGLSLIQI